MNTNENRSIKVDSSDFSDSEGDENTKLIMSAPVLSTESRRRFVAGGKLFDFNRFQRSSITFILLFCRCQQTHN